jgi:glycosyltransferase involved in cell wall biosynthesis
MDLRPEDCSKNWRTAAPPLLSVIIPVRNDSIRLERCLASLLADQSPEGGMEIIVGDNGSKDECAGVATAAGAKLVKLPGMNVASVRNRAATHAEGELLAFVDADHTIERGWIAAAVSAFRQPEVGAAGLPYSAPNPGSWVQRTYDRLRQRPNTVQQVEWLGSGNLVVRRDVFMKLGGFDASLETCEDVDLCGRLRRAGYRLLANPGMPSTHWGDPATLAAVFRGELWRGRNNLRVSLRKPYSLRNLASAIIPLANLIAVLVAGCAFAIVPGQLRYWILLPILTWSLSLTLRAGKMQQNTLQWNASTVMQNLAVAAVFEAARMFALVLRTSHRRRAS